MTSSRSPSKPTRIDRWPTTTTLLQEKRLALDTYARGRAGGKEGLRIRHNEVLYPMFQMLLDLSPIDMNTGTREKKYRGLVGSEARQRKSAEMN